MITVWHRVAIPGLPILAIALAGLAFPLMAPDPSTVRTSGPARVEDFVRALGDQGAQVQVVRPVAQPCLRAAAGWLVEVYGVPVQVYEYATEAEWRSDGARVPARTDVAWVDQPHIWASGRLVVVYVGQNRALADLISTVLGQPVTQAARPAAQSARTY